MLIGLHGKKGHGKSTIAAHLVAQHGFLRLRFAGPLKECLCAQLFGMTEAQTDGFLKEAPCVDVTGLDPCELAESTVELLWPDASDAVALTERWQAVYTPIFAGATRLYSPREIMRVIGGGAREHLAASTWLDLWRDAYRACAAARVVVDDVRYPNEKAALEAEGGEVWRVVRTDLAPTDDHPSETACDRLPDQSFGAAIRRPAGVPALGVEVDRLIAARAARVLEEVG